MAGNLMVGGSGRIEDRPRWILVAAVATAGLLTGVTLARVTLDHGQTGPASHTTRPAEIHPGETGGQQPGRGAVDAPGGTPSASDPPSESDFDGDEATSLEASEERVHPVTTGEEDSSSEASTAAPEAARATARAERTVRVGRVAYLRCDGAEVPGRSFPCPRDPALEQIAWDAIRALPSCPGAPTEVGQADVRIHFERGATPEVRVRNDGDLSAERLLNCLRAPLESAQTAIDADPMVISFRFELEAAH